MNQKTHKDQSADFVSQTERGFVIREMTHGRVMPYTFGFTKEECIQTLLNHCSVKTWSEARKQFKYQCIDVSITTTKFVEP